ncbi:phosphoglycerol transferase MdoB-like AlkP superfamily enzyme [Labrenzia sp. EL_208]|nr:phosphoglycerol transferase MdoB-like AlkP superfamily enzyme [Labrenzia sp. EL_132]MBG6232387.1 phosphoglycerol transferase MdoB-like AlkP superfamily enzyme [Labrenzia sp. EL_208]
MLDFAAFVSRYFQMPLPMLLDSMQFLDELNLSQSATYLAFLAILVALLVLTYKMVTSIKKHRNNISLVSFLVFAIFCGSLDHWLNATPQEAMKIKMQFAESFVPIKDAASLKTGIAQVLQDDQRSNVLIVMVEGLGAFSSPEHQKTVWGPLLDEEIGAMYAIKQGTTQYFGSTTSGEARELCNLRADYRDFRDKKFADCLPKWALESGYKTAAFHAFTNEFFERKDWFPKIGFEELFFLENRAGLNPSELLSLCGITFRGLCDADVSRSVEAYLTGEEAQPKFAYWLTLNSHKPVMPGEVPERLGCEDGGVFGDQELCRMSEQWLNISHLVKEIALNENLRETEVLLVGDHHPPLFNRKARKLFEPGQVAWLHLKRLNSRQPEQFAAVGLRSGEETKN